MQLITNVAGKFKVVINQKHSSGVEPSFSPHVVSRVNKARRKCVIEIISLMIYFLMVNAICYMHGSIQAIATIARISILFLTQEEVED